MHLGREGRKSTYTKCQFQYHPNGNISLSHFSQTLLTILFFECLFYFICFRLLMVLSVFSLLNSRSLYLTYFKDASYKGIPTQIFSIPDEVLAGSRTNPDNACFCMETDSKLIEERCTLDGVFDASLCQDDVPIIISLPHFMNADKRITDNIIGLKPDENLHRPELHVEPVCFFDI